MVYLVYFLVVLEAWAVNHPAFGTLRKTTTNKRISKLANQAESNQITSHFEAGRRKVDLALSSDARTESHALYEPQRSSVRKEK